MDAPRGNALVTFSVGVSIHLSDMRTLREAMFRISSRHSKESDKDDVLKSDG